MCRCHVGGHIYRRELSALSQPCPAHRIHIGPSHVPALPCFSLACGMPSQPCSEPLFPSKSTTLPADLAPPGPRAYQPLRAPVLAYVLQPQLHADAHCQRRCLNSAPGLGRGLCTLALKLCHTSLLALLRPCSGPAQAVLFPSGLTENMVSTLPTALGTLRTALAKLLRPPFLSDAPSPCLTAAGSCELPLGPAQAP